MPFKTKVTKFIEYFIFRSVVALLQIIPLRIRIFIGERFMLLFSLLLKKNRELIQENIRFAFPQKDEQWVLDVAKKNIKNMGRIAAEFLELLRFSEEDYNKRIVHTPSKEETIEWFKNGGIIILGHTGNWEWQGAMIAHWLPNHVYALAQRQSNPWSNRFFQKVRTKGGLHSIFTDVGILQAFKILKKNKILCFLADQDARGNGIFVDFLNRPASTFIGPAVMARNTNAPLFFAFSYFENNKLHTLFEKLPKPSFDPEQDPEKWERTLTETWVKRLEELVKQHPVDYFWAHNRWKTKPANAP